MARRTERDEIIYCVSFLRVVERFERYDMVNVGLSSYFLRPFPTVLTPVVITFEGLIPGLPPLAGVRAVTFKPLMVILSAPVL